MPPIPSATPSPRSPRIDSRDLLLGVTVPLGPCHTDGFLHPQGRPHPPRPERRPARARLPLPCPSAPNCTALTARIDNKHGAGYTVAGGAIEGGTGDGALNLGIRHLSASEAPVVTQVSATCALRAAFGRPTWKFARATVPRLDGWTVVLEDGNGVRGFGYAHAIPPLPIRETACGPRWDSCCRCWPAGAVGVAADHGGCRCAAGVRQLG